MNIPSRGQTVGEMIEESEHKHAQWVKAINGLVYRAKVLNDDGVLIWNQDFNAIQALLSEEIMKN